MLSVILQLAVALASASAAGDAPDVDRAFSLDGALIHVKAGAYVAAGAPVSIAHDATFAVRPADTAEAADEPLELPDVEPGGFWKGAQLAGPRTVNINAPGSFIEDALTVRDAETGRVLAKGKDYRVSAPYALLGLGTDTDLAPEAPVLVSYRYHLQRIDAIVCDERGRVALIEGTPAVAEPAPPETPAGAVRLANVYRPFGARDVQPDHLYPILADGVDAVTRTTRGRIPRTLGRIRDGQPVTIVCLGDSITAGGDASAPDRMFVEQFAAGLRARFPEAELGVVNVSIGGTRSAQWLHDGDYPGTRKLPPDECTFDRVLRENPNLVIVEFLNDMTLPPEDLPGLYDDLMQRVTDAGAELALVAPGFCHPSIMGTTTLEDGASKPYVPLIRFLHAFAEGRGAAFVDVAGRWEHLRREGLPYMTLLRNGYNHPGDRGHALCAEELLKCFE